MFTYICIYNLYYIYNLHRNMCPLFTIIHRWIYIYIYTFKNKKFIGKGKYTLKTYLYFIFMKKPFTKSIPFSVSLSGQLVSLPGNMSQEQTMSIGQGSYRTFRCSFKSIVEINLKIWTEKY